MIMGKDSPEYVMANRFSEDVLALTDGEVFFEILPKLKTTETRGLLEKISKGDIGGGIAWTHYWSSYHPATMLFGSPTAGAGLGFDNISWVSWYYFRQLNLILNCVEMVFSRIFFKGLKKN